MITHLKLINELLQSNLEFKTSLMNLESVKWFPIVYFDNPELKIGILQDGRWVVEGKNKLFDLFEPKSYIRVMALLEKPLNTIREIIINFFKLTNLSSEVYDVFPFVYIIKSGLEQESEYWAELAFKWFDELPIEKKELLRDSLIKITKAKWASQKLRHRAIKEIAKLEKINK